MSKIKTVDPLEYGKSRATGPLGRVEFDKEGYFVVPEGKEKEARHLCNVSPTLSFIEGGDGKEVEVEKDPPVAPLKKVEDKKDPVKSTEPKVEETKEEAVDKKESAPVDAAKVEAEDDIKQPPVDDGVKETKADPAEAEALKEILEDKGIDELRQICYDAGVKEEEIKDFKGKEGKASLIDLIIKRDLV